MIERRASQRIPMALPVEIRWEGLAGSPMQAMGVTGNISGSGVFIESPIGLDRATSVMIRVILPREVTKVALELLCHGRVARCNQHGQAQGLGAVIDEYELRPVPQVGSGGERPHEGK